MQHPAIPARPHPSPPNQYVVDDGPCPLGAAPGAAPGSFPEETLCAGQSESCGVFEQQRGVSVWDVEGLRCAASGRVGVGRQTRVRIEQAYRGPPAAPAGNGSQQLPEGLAFLLGVSCVRGVSHYYAHWCASEIEVGLDCEQSAALVQNGVFDGLDQLFSY